MASSEALGGSGIGLEALGMAGQLVGGFEQAGYSAKISAASQDIAQAEKQKNLINWQQALVNSRRNQLQLIRNAQQARSLALASATNQGAQKGSGLQGGLANVSGETETGLLGISQNEQLGFRMFQTNDRISQDQMNIAKYQGQAAMWGGLSSAGQGATSLGSSIVSGSQSSLFNA